MDLGCWTWLLWALAAVAVYVILDRLVRLPFLGGRKDRFVLITGCDSGFGHATAKRLDASGCHVFATCLTENGRKALQDVCSSHLVALLMDVRDPDSVNNAKREVERRLPPNRGLWGIINNAGITRPFGPIDWRSTLDDYKDCIDVNLFGVINVTTTFLQLVKKEHGRIVNMASVAGIIAPYGVAPYSISKYGVEAFSDTLRRELIPFGCSVHLVEPGLHKTNMTTLAVWTTAWDQASPEVKAQYGEDFHDKLTCNIEDTIQMISAGVDGVVATYEHALFGRFPRARYLVGNEARFLFRTLTLLPEWLSDKILTGFLNIAPPIAAGSKKTN